MVMMMMMMMMMMIYNQTYRCILMQASLQQHADLEEKNTYQTVNNGRVDMLCNVRLNPCLGVFDATNIVMLQIDKHINC